MKNDTRAIPTATNAHTTIPLLRPFHPGSEDTDPQPQSQPRVADARPVDPVPPPVQNQPAVPEPVDHYEEEIRRQYRPCPWLPLP